MSQDNKHDAITIARTKLLLNHPWFGSLALKLNIKEADEEMAKILPTAGVDGVTLYYNRKWFDSLQKLEQIAIVAHEVMHCALLHPLRIGYRDKIIANIAMDYVINNELVANGFSLPKGALIDKQYEGMEWEKVYALLMKNAKTVKVKDLVKMFSEGGGKDGQPNIGGVMPAPKDGGKDADGNPIDLEIDWKTAVEQATIVAQKAGKMPAGLARAMEANKKSKTCWQEVLKQWISKIGDYSWAAPNRRFIHAGLVIPGTVKTKMSCLVIAVDTSGSIGAGMLNDFASEINAIFDAEASPEKAYIIYCDAKVGKVDEIDNDFIDLKPVGGGGTAFNPVFDYVKENGIEPECLIYLTDLECFDKPSEPEYPVLWVAPDWCTRKAEFGETIYIDSKD